MCGSATVSTKFIVTMDHSIKQSQRVATPKARLDSLLIRCILNELDHGGSLEVELYFFADQKKKKKKKNDQTRRKKRVNQDLAGRRNTQGTESIS